MSTNYEDLDYVDPESDLLDQISEKRKKLDINIRSILNRKGKVTNHEMDELFLI